MRVLLAALLAIPLLAPPAPGQEAGAAAETKTAVPRPVFTVAPSGWYAEVRAGFASQQLDDPDANIAYVERIAVEGLDAKGPLRRFDTAQDFAVEFGRRHGSVGVGIAGELQRQRVRTFASGTSVGAVDAISLMSIMDVRLVGSYRPRWLYGFELGASAGLAFAHYSEQFAIYVFPAPEFGTNLSGAFHAVSFSGGPHLGWRRPLLGDTWLTARATWLYRNFDELKGQYRERQGDQAEIVDDSLRRLADGEFASIDGSGVQLTAGLSYTFAGRR